MFPFLALNSSNLKSSPTYRSPPTKRSLLVVTIPMNDETPAIFSCFANNVGAVTVVIPFKVVKPSMVTMSLKKDSPKNVETPDIPATSPTESWETEAIPPTTFIAVSALIEPPEAAAITLTAFDCPTRALILSPPTRTLMFAINGLLLLELTHFLQRPFVY